MVKNIAHRGFSGKYPENTLLAFKKAIETGCDGIEMDVHLTKDDVVVIIHDETIDRTTNGTGRVCDYTYEQLCQFDASSDYMGVYGFEKIPTLREYFELIADHKAFITNIELKTGVIWYKGIEEKVLELIDEFDRRDTVIISSFNHYCIQRMKALAPDVKCGYLEESWILNPGAYCKAGAVECYHPYFYNMVPEQVAELKENGIEINVWTVNTVTDIQDMLDKGVDGIITNFPDVCKEMICARKG